MGSRRVPAQAASGALLDMQQVTPASFTTASNTYVAVTGSTITLANPNRPVIVEAMGGGYLSQATAGDIQDFRVGISTDGGTTWTYGGTPAASDPDVGSRQPVFTSAAVAGVTPTGTVQARLETQNRTAARNATLSQPGLTMKTFVV